MNNDPMLEEVTRILLEKGATERTTRLERVRAGFAFCWMIVWDHARAKAVFREVAKRDPSRERGNLLLRVINKGR